MSYIQKQGKNTAWKNALMRNLATDLIIHEKLNIVYTRAKELQSHVDKLVTLGKSGTLHDRRRVASYLRQVTIDKTGKTVVQKLFDEIARKYKKREGGYTRVLKTTNRRGDNAVMAIIEFV